jgi:predicted transcriptional regulator
MSLDNSTTARSILDLTAEIVAAHVGHNEVSADRLPALIRGVHRTLAGLTTGPATTTAAPDKPQPAVPVKRSVFDDYIVCLEDGKKLKMLKRHLQTTYNMTPDDYRTRWGLPADYPMVALSYARHRSTVAKSQGLGQKTAAAAKPEEPRSEPAVTYVPARHARGSRR